MSGADSIQPTARLHDRSDGSRLVPSERPVSVSHPFRSGGPRGPLLPDRDPPGWTLRECLLAAFPLPCGRPGEPRPRDRETKMFPPMHRRRNSSAPRWPGPMIAIALAKRPDRRGSHGAGRACTPANPRDTQYAISDVRRADLYPMIRPAAGSRAGSRPSSSASSRICGRRPRARGSPRAGRRSSSRSSPKGTLVKRGDVLAVLDSADYVELLRLQEMTVERAQADKLQAELDSRDRQARGRGIPRRHHEGDDRGLPAPGHAGAVRPRACPDRLNWTHSMKDEGVRLHQHGQHRRVHGRRSSSSHPEAGRGAFDLFRKYTAPKTIRELEGAVMGAECDPRLRDAPLAAPSRSARDARAPGRAAARSAPRTTAMSSTPTTRAARSSSRRGCPSVRVRSCSTCPT